MSEKLNSLWIVFLTLSQILLIIGQINCQSEYIKTIRPGAKWELDRSLGMGRNELYYVTISCETVNINSHQYSIVNVEPRKACGIGGYAREDTLEKKIYFIPFEDEELAEKLIIDYSLEQGDTFFLHNGWGNQVVDTIRPSNFLDYQVNFIDFGIGVADGFREIIGFYSTGPIMKCEGWVRVTDYEFEEPNCNLVNNTSSIDFEKEIKVWPNPVGSELFIRVEPEITELPIRIKIKTLLGELVLEENMHGKEKTVYLDKLPKGLLFIEFWQDHTVINKKIYHF